MAFFKTVWKNIGCRVWLIVTSILLVLLLVVSLVLTQNMFLRNTLNTVLGRGNRYLVSGNPSDYIYYPSDYESKEATLAAANELNERIVEEGIVLLKNEGNALPIPTQVSDSSVSSSPRVSVFGKNSVDLVYGGSGSGGGNAADAATLEASLTAAGYTVNPVLQAFYEDDARSGSGRGANPAMGSILAGLKTGETPQSSYTDEVKASYAEYDDAAIVVLSRIGGEGFDLPRTMKTSFADDAEPVEGAKSADSHYLELDANEDALLSAVCAEFDKVVLLVNSSQPMELGFLYEGDYAQKIQAALWIGGPGSSGINALGRILNGTVNPSGRLVDTYARDFTADPTYRNFSNNMVNDGDRYNVDGSNVLYFFVEYEEGIYVGYRYWETRGYTEAQAGNEEWYAQNVVYPFGYGLSYTSFDWEVIDRAPAADSVLDADGSIEITVRVTNTGDVPGKDVVQLYYTAPYTAGGVEKAHVVLGDFAKTDLLYPAEQAGEGKPNYQDITLTVDVRDMASYDYTRDLDGDAEAEGAYVLDSGRYEVKLSRNAHDVVDATAYTLAEEQVFTTDADTDAAVENRFNDVSSHIRQYLSRSDWQGTWPTTPTDADRSVTREFINSLTYTVNDSASDPWYTDEMPEQSSYIVGYEDAEVQLYDLISWDKESGTVTVDYEDERWDTLLDQLTVGQMAQLIGTGNFNTMEIEGISKPRTIDPDGPSGFTNFMGDPSVYGTCFYATECVVGATWNVQLAYEMGKMVGNESIWGNQAGGGIPYSGWYAPAVNIHRSPFSGRNWEYYSEDGFLSGMMGASVIKGAREKGVYTYVKHFVLNDQETNRDANGLLTWANEQAMRELYFKPFELAVKEGETKAMMSSFNRIGTVWAGGSYALLTEVLREEWGFRGMVVTDYNLYEHMPADQMIRAGGDLNLTQSKMPSTTDLTATQVSCIRNATKNILYTVAGSNAMNGYGAGVVYRYEISPWMLILFCADAGIAVALAAWGAAVIVLAVKKQRAKTAGEKSASDHADGQ